jgi:hypothetical protein
MLQAPEMLDTTRLLFKPRPTSRVRLRQFLFNIARVATPLLAALFL